MTKIKSFSDVLRKTYDLVKPYGRRKLFLVFAVVIIRGFIEVAGIASIFPFLALATDPEQFRSSVIGRSLLEKLPPMDDSFLLCTAGIASILILLLSNVLRLFSDYVRAFYGHNFGHWLRIRMLQEMITQPWSYFLNNNTGILLKKIATDVTFFVHQVLLALLEGFSNLISIFFLVVMIFLVDARISILVGLTVVIFYCTVFILLERFQKRLSDLSKINSRGAMKEGQQLLGGTKTIKIALAEKFFLNRYGKHSGSIARVGTFLPLIQNGPKYLFEPLAFGGLIVFFIWNAARGEDITKMAPVLGIIGFAAYRLLPAAQMLYLQFSQISSSRHFLEEVSEEFNQLPGSKSVDSKSSVRKLTRPKPLKWKNEIFIDRLSFVYKGSEKSILSDLSIHIPRNSSLGVIGPTGSGKSTLIDLILGLHRPGSGRILVDGTEITPHNVRDWQAGIGYVPQDIFVIDDSITRNIALGLDDAQIDSKRVKEVAKAAQILDFIENDLTNGFDTLVGERGIRLSGGQRQRLALARALYNRPSLLILDEATSALDYEIEAKVMSAVQKLEGTITILIVAHRLSTVERCDQLINLSDINKAMAVIPVKSSG